MDERVSYSTASPLPALEHNESIIHLEVQFGQKCIILSLVIVSIIRY